MGWASRRSFLAQAGAGLALSGCLSAVARDHLAVFDAMWKTVDEWYFDPTMGGVDWKAVRRDWRPKAARAETPAALYLDVLIPVLDQFRTSHVEIRPPGPLALSNGRSFGIPRQKRGTPFFMISPEDEAGMGAVLTWDGSAYVLEDVVPRSPAHEAGLWPSQRVQIAGSRYLKAGRQLHLIDRQGASFLVTWSPKAAPPLVETQALAGGTTYLRFNVFDQPSVARAIEVLGVAGPLPVVLDLRQNTGGLIVEMARLTSALLPGGRSIGLFRSRKREHRPLTKPVSTGFIGSLAVLLGPRTASAAEITAAALQHHGRARLFGARTSGSVLASQIFDLPDGGKLTVPHADYLTPSGTRIEDRGVTPDVIAPRTAASMANGSDPALDAALGWLRRGQ